MENKPQFEKMPEHFPVCFSTTCSQADSCLLSIVARSGKHQDNMLYAVNPSLFGGKSCKFFKPNIVVKMAYGMKDSFRDVKAVDIAAMRETLIGHFGRGSYYLRRNGKRGITPDEQQYIQKVFSKFGYQLKFDKIVEETLWM